MAIHATIDLLADKPDTPWIGRILQQNPHYGEAYAVAGNKELAITNYQRSIELDPKNADGVAKLKKLRETRKD